MASPSRSGVFQTSADSRVDQFTESVSVDKRLYVHDIAGSIAHARMLADVGLIEAGQCAQLVEQLQEIERQIAEDRFPLRVELEDIHMHIEDALIERLGDVGRMLHTGAAATIRSAQPPVCGSATRWIGWIAAWRPCSVPSWIDVTAILL